MGCRAQGVGEGWHGVAAVHVLVPSALNPELTVHGERGFVDVEDDTTLEATQRQILSQSPTDATSSRRHFMGVD